MIDLMRLRAFVYAAESLSFSEAARQLHVTQPTISHHIKALEKTIGVELFTRSGHTLKLTEGGRLLLPFAHKLIHQAIEVQELMGSLQEDIVGDLRIACSTTVGKYTLPILAARFCQRFPSINISIMSCRPVNVIPQLLEGHANLAVVSSYELCSNGFECQEFFRDRILLIVPADHPWALRDFVEPADLLDEPLLIREPTSGTRRHILTEFARHDIGMENLDVLLELGTAEAIAKTVEAGYGVSFISSLAAEWALALGRIVSVPVVNIELQRTTYMARRKLGPPNRAQQAFWNFVHHPTNADLLNSNGRQS